MPQAARYFSTVARLHPTSAAIEEVDMPPST